MKTTHATGGGRLASISARDVKPLLSYAALGDSYAAGGGAGTPEFGTCGRFSDAYPVQIANDTGLDISSHDFRNLACGGTTTNSVLYRQVPWMGNPDLVTITVGGNEISFFAILNACIYHWLPANPCDEEVAGARALIESSSLLDHYSELISATLRHLPPHGLLLITGYAQFFNDQTSLCDHITFSRTRPLDRLTKAKRRALNELVVMLNQVIRSVAETRGATYVDIDRVFQGHRFCEPGISEPDLERQETWFFNLPRTEFGSQPATYDAKQDQQERLAIQTLRAVPNSIGVASFPDLDSARTFHPTGLGHTAMAQSIVQKVLGHRLTSRWVGRVLCD
ncbi:hypothetical protein B0A52_02940 [Exophiala mesophila]|uniref:SGNH hydrolase-type esterase domain-containing protein n=1 Tax=Exophiala mesophila TaxID=212818 RepID=A0A438NBZ0_EXOME|nr:hypothetical protein B0A52_02940 [Exophiala mesophila]